jgi:uncharacterized RDD family membrane protein YckC
MKCPKCGYLGFEHVDRCRNCGYDFSLDVPSIDLPELQLRGDAQTMSPLDDLALLDRGNAAPRAQPVRENPAVPAAELPLFGGNDLDPLITKLPPPRPPLAVRRATPEVPRLRSEQPRGHTLELDLDPPSAVLPPPVGAMSRAHAADWPATIDAREPAQDAPLGARFMAMVLDVVILAAVDAVVIYFTMQICGITIREIGILPKGPLFAFLLVQNGGYLVIFTTGGQTLGKMATGIKVVTAGTDSPLDPGRAALRTLIWVLLAVPAGLGLLTAVMSHDHRGLHDRFARTRVVRASA